MEKPVDVVVVGAGPVGLLTAIELTLGGLQVLVLERLATPSQTIKALGIGPLGYEALQRRGMAAALADAEARNLTAVDQARQQSGRNVQRAKYAGHFAFLFIPSDAQKEPNRRMRLINQQSLETILADRAEALGIELRRSCEVTGFRQHEDGVEVAWTSPAGESRISCAYLVGCDGGRSAIRKMTGFDFPGTAPTMTMYQAIADIDDPNGSLPFGWQRMTGGVVACGPFPRRMFMLDFSGPPADREVPVTREEIETVLRRVSGADVRVRTLEVANRWTDNTRLVDTYRKGRVLLAGDAAHIHSPFGGQGLSLGLADAANLGWKLSAVVRGEMPESLLDTYTVERRPVAEAVLANTLAQVAIMRPDPQSGAMRDIMSTLMQFDDVGRTIGGIMTGLSTRYDLGTTQDAVGRLIGDKPVGTSSLYELMHDGGGVFLDASPQARASDLVASLAPQVRRAAVDESVSMLIRPDGCVAWVGSADNIDGLAEALRRWFGSFRLPLRGGLPLRHPVAHEGV